MTERIMQMCTQCARRPKHVHVRAHDLRVCMLHAR